MPIFRLMLCAVALLAILAGCGDDEGDILSPAISPDAGNAYFVHSDSVHLTGTMEAGATIEVNVADTAVVANLTVGVDTWSFDIAGLTPGANGVSVTARDDIGNQNTLFMTVTYDFISLDRLVTPVDPAVTPTLDLAGTLADTITDAAMVTFEVTPLPNNPLPTPVLDLANHRWTADFDLTGEVEETYTLVVAANDGVTSYSITSGYTLALAGTAPLVTITPPTLPVTTSALTVVGTRTADAAVTVQLNTVDQVVDTSIADQWSVDLNLRPGKNFITVKVTDALEQTATAFESIWFE